MAAIHVHCTVRDAEARESLRLMTDYPRWAEASDAIDRVVVTPSDDGSSTSFWEVTFRGGLMKWSERDSCDLDKLVHEFDLIEGDPHAFSGTWTATEVDGGCELRMTATFDLGMPSLSHVLDPIAVEALEDAVVDAVHHLFGDRATVAYGEPAHA
jgi:hypothetical protein